MQAQWVCSRERRIALYKRSSITQSKTTNILNLKSFFLSCFVLFRLFVYIVVALFGGGGGGGGGGCLYLIFVSCWFACFLDGSQQNNYSFFFSSSASFLLFYCFILLICFFFYIYFWSSFLFFQICCARPVLEILSLSDGVVHNRCTAEARNSTSILSTLSFSLWRHWQRTEQIFVARENRANEYMRTAKQSTYI